MMGIGEIRRLNEEATNRSRSRRSRPYVPSAADRERLAGGDLSPARIPFLGDYVPDGFERTDDSELFVDMSGFGTDYEPALSQPQFARTIADDPEGTGYGLTEHGQFQGNVARYRELTDA